MMTLKLLDDRDQEYQILNNRIKELYDGENELVILEAGCGRRWWLNLNSVDYKLIGVDLDEDALNSRVNKNNDLDETIVADLQDFNLGKNKVDVIFNSFVLEHVENADRMLENFNNMLKPGGLLILKLPDRDTVFGFMTRITPFWFHVMYKKYVQGLKEAGKPGFAPYPTYYNKVVSREGIHHFAVSHGFKINDEYGSCCYLRQKSVKIKVIKAFVILISIFSAGKLPWKYNNLTYVLAKTS